MGRLVNMTLIRILAICVAILVVIVISIGILYRSDSPGLTTQETDSGVDASGSPTLTNKNVGVPNEPTSAKVFSLDIVNPPVSEVVTRESTIVISGLTRQDAVITVDQYVVEPDINGLFQYVVDLSEGINYIEVIASISTGEQKKTMLVVGYVPQ
jgi:hypothetical protein